MVVPPNQSPCQHRMRVVIQSPITAHLTIATTILFALGHSWEGRRGRREGEREGRKEEGRDGREKGEGGDREGRRRERGGGGRLVEMDEKKGVTVYGRNTLCSVLSLL